MKNEKYLVVSFAIALAIGVLAAMPSFSLTAQAASLTQSQIDAIVSLLQSFGADQTAINSVQNVLGGTSVTPPTTAWCHNFNVNLGIGSRGDEVDALRSALAKEGFPVEVSQGVGTANNFDETLASAVTAFQQKYADEILTPLGLKYGTGYVGKSTRAKLNKLYGCGITSPNCIQVITPAKNPQTGECKNFPTPCDVSSGWQKVDKCETITPTTPSITVLSPNGGEKWQLGKTYTIKWSYTNGTHIDGYLYRTSGGPIYKFCGMDGSCTDISKEPFINVDASVGQETFRVGENFIPANDYKIHLSLSAEGDKEVAKDDSDAPFSIVAATPSNTVLSPNGGETWKIGSLYDVKWTNTTGKSVRIELIKGTNVVYSWGPIYADVTTYNIALATSLNLQPGSDYKIRIASLDANNTVDYKYYDTSDAPFSIIITTSVVGQSSSEINQIASVLGSMEQVMNHTTDTSVVDAMKKIINQLEETINKLKNQ